MIPMSPPAEQTRVNVMQPWLGEEEVAAVAEVIRSGWVAQGPRVFAADLAGEVVAVRAGSRPQSRTTTALALWRPQDWPFED